MNVTPEPPERLQTVLRYQGRKFAYEVNHLRLPNGAEGTWECIYHPGGALAVPMLADGRLVLVEQYRFAAQGRLLEFPAGTVEPGEAPQQTIEREIQEEIGYRAGRWTSLGEFFLAPGYSDEIIYAFLARDLEALEHPPQGDADEDLRPVLMTPAELESAILAGRPVDAKTVTSFLLARPHLPQS